MGTQNKCHACGAPVGENERGELRFDSSAYHADAANKLSEISMWMGHAQRLEGALRYWMPDETMIPPEHKQAWDEHIELLTDC